MPKTLTINTPRWALPLLPPNRYKGAKGGRGSGKSHFFAELLVEEHIAYPDMQSVCIREIQKSLKFSAKKLIEDKIRAMGMSHLFEITINEIRRINGAGILIFQGMQDHTADSIKSLEGFDRAWVEEAQSLSYRSMELLLPTIRAPGSQLWFSWNPDQPTDAIEQLFAEDNSGMVCIHVNFTDNPFCPQELLDEAARHLKRNPDTYAHVWEGAHNTKSDAQILNNKWRVDEFTPGANWDGPYQGLDFGFALDPTAGVRCWVHGDNLYVEHEACKIALELDDTARHVANEIPGFERYAIRADSARPESISYLKRKGLPRIEAVKKWPGSVEDGIQHLRSYAEIVIHPRCKETISEARLYSYKIDRKSGDIMPAPVDAHNHCIDAVRYALGPLIKLNDFVFA